MGGLAVVIASTGTAVAVTATTVDIADPTVPTRIAHVDALGRVNTTDATSTINSAFCLSVGYNVLTSKTTASLAISRVSYFNSGLYRSFANADFNESLVKITTGASGDCTGSDRSISSPYSLERNPVGSQAATTYPAPLVTRSIAAKPYRLAILVQGRAPTRAPTTFPSAS
ncbi:MAG: hypothetical protein ABI873_16680 [Marmoricola sp.]